MRNVFTVCLFYFVIFIVCFSLGRYLAGGSPKVDSVITLNSQEWECATSRPATSDKARECIVYWRIN